MEQITFETNNKKSIKLLIAIAEEMGIRQVTSKTGVQDKRTKSKYDFSDLYGKLKWNGDALAEQKKIRSEWK